MLILYRCILNTKLWNAPFLSRGRFPPLFIVSRHIIVYKTAFSLSFLFRIKEKWFESFQTYRNRVLSLSLFDVTSGRVLYIIIHSLIIWLSTGTQCVHLKCFIHSTVNFMFGKETCIGQYDRSPNKTTQTIKWRATKYTFSFSFLFFFLTISWKWLQCLNLSSVLSFFYRYNNVRLSTHAILEIYRRDIRFRRPRMFLLWPRKYICDF